jgi:FAD/FMN-containing dehydrogenase
VFPRSEDEVAEVVREAAGNDQIVRVVGTRHSSVPIVGTDRVLISLDRFSGLASHVKEEQRVTLHAGTRVRAVSDILLGLGLGMRNLGDVDVQSIAGVVGTGTHGIGLTLGNISSGVRSLRIVDGRGGVVDVDGSNPELPRAARVALGSIGIIVAVELDLIDAYRLKEHVWYAPVEECMDALDDNISGNRHSEFFWGPGQDACMMKTLNVVEEDGPSGTPLEGDRVGWSPHIITSVRESKFHEMEYQLPAEDGPECFGRVRDRMRSHHPDIAWPVEYRTLAGDDAMLSPAHGRATVTISVHQDARLPHEPFFDDIEQIFHDYDGRPHWGKYNTLGRDRLRELYPDWDAFSKLRDEVDPEGIFLNDCPSSLFRG